MEFKKERLILIKQTLWVLTIAFLQSCQQEKKTHSVAADAIQAQLPHPEISDSALPTPADTLYAKGKRLKAEKKVDSALYLHLQAHEIWERDSNKVRLLDSNLAISEIYLLLDKFGMAIKYLENARTIAETKATPSARLFDIYSYLVKCNYELKNFPDAILYAQRMLSLGKSHNSSTEIADAYRRFADINYFQKDYDRAIENWQKAASLSRKDDHLQLARLFHNIATAYQVDGKIDHALYYINKALAHDFVEAGPRSELVAKRYIAKAPMLLDQGKKDSCLLLLRKALLIRREVYGEKNVNIFGAYHSIGNFYEQIGSYDSALWYHQQSLVSLIKSFGTTSWHKNPVPAIEELDDNLVLGLTNKAEALVKMHDSDTSNIGLLQLSLDTDFLADSVFEEYKKNLAWDESVLAQIETGHLSYSGMLKKIFSLYQRTNNQGYIRQALKIMERSRAAVLQGGLNRAVAFGSAGVPKELQIDERRLMTSRSNILQSLTEKEPEQRVKDSLYEALRKIEDDYLNLQSRIKKVSPSYFAIKFGSRVADLDQLKNVLKNLNSVLLEFFWSPEAIYALVVRPGQVVFTAIPVSTELNSAIEMFKREFKIDPEGALEHMRYQSFCSNSSLIYNLLLRDLLIDVLPETHLIISADGPLATLPFEALLTDPIKSNEANYKNLPYLVTKYPASYSFSASVLLTQMAHEREGSKLLAMGYAGPGFSRQNRDGVSNLPGTEKEIKAIQEVMENDINRYYVEGGSTENNFKKQVADYDVVHLALHGEGDTLNSMNSKLIFRTEHDTTEDGQLFAHELYNLNLHNLDLAVLSACESGVGKQQKGEGVMSIARGFAYAGCPSLVISLWKIDDRITAEVMSRFYKNISDAKPLDVSLAQAKRDYIKNAGELTSHPFYWAAFLQVGNAQELDVKKMPNGWSWAFVILVILVVVGTIAYRLVTSTGTGT